MMKRLLMTIAAIACLMLTSHAAPVPVCAPDDFDEALELMGAKTPEQKLDLTITILNNAYENLGDYIKVLKDDYNNKVVMLIDGSKLGVDVSDMTFNATDLMKGVFIIKFIIKFLKIIMIESVITFTVICFHQIFN